MSRWERALGDFTLAEVRVGIEASLAWSLRCNKGFPPALVDFLPLCRPTMASTEPLHRRLQLADRERRLSAPVKRSTKDTARAHLQAIREKLKGGDHG